MNILHVLSQFEVTGAEVYAVTLADEQVRRGHRVLMVSDTLTTPTRAEYHPQPIGNRRYPSRFRNIRFLTELVRRERIDVIHAHSRAASWVSLWAARRAKIPLVSSVHGRQHLHASSRSFSVYGDRVIAVNESLRDHLIADLGLSPGAIDVIPNALRTSYWSEPVGVPDRQELFGVSPETRTIVVAGRLSGPKGDVVRFLLRSVAPELLSDPAASLHLIGGNETPADIAALIDGLRSSCGSRISIRGHQSDLRPFYRNADVVIGAGRVAMEALAVGCRVLAFGESGYAGPVRTDTFNACAVSNFGDTGAIVPADPRVILGDLRDALGRQNEDGRDRLRTFVSERYDVERIADRVHENYRTARLTRCVPSSIPVLMYHRVVAEAAVGSRHGLWVTAKTFESQLRSLRRRGIVPVTFRQIDRFLEGDGVLPRRPVILTFDDGYTDNAEVAVPLLRRYGMTAVIYLVTDPLRRSNFWDADEPQVPLMGEETIRGLAREGIEFGGHTVTHADLTRTDHAATMREVLECKQAVERVTGEPVVSFAYPYGRLNAVAKQCVREAGYRFAVAADSGPLVFGDDPLEVRRSQVFPWTGAFGFWKKTQPWYLRYKSRKNR